jgi:8-oxo-dGTP pyrophosphatase MutT (NUDIX family)
MGNPADLVATVRASVQARHPVDERERVSIGRFLAELDRLAHPFDRDADLVHVTGSAIVTGPAGVLLLRHRRLGIWLQPGGHVDPGETPWAAAEREAREETGLAVRLVSTELTHVDVHAGGRGHTHLDLRYLVAVDTESGHAEPAPPPGESQEIGWFGWDDAIAIADDGLRGALVALRPTGR